jgi:hypothetical protein
MLTLAFPDGRVKWGANALSSMSKAPYTQAMLTYPVSAVMLNLTGIIFAIQFVTLLCIGAYADFGNWRPFLLIGE